MTQYPMVEQVNRLIGNMLAADKTVGLPGVGTLRRVRRPARRIDKRTVAPPCYVVDFSSTVAETTLPDEIARALRIAAQANGSQPDPAATTAQAQDIYNRWLHRTLQDGVLTIAGVGILKNKHFALDDAFDTRLNPQGHAPVRIKVKRRFDWTMALGCIAVCAAATIGIYAYFEFFGEGSLLDSPRSERQSPETEAVTQHTNASAETAATPAAETETPESSADADTPVSADPATASHDTASAQTAPSAATATTPTTAPANETATSRPATQPAAENRASVPNAAQLISGHRYVVLGVFSTQANAERAAREATEKDGSFRCGVYRYGPKFMVSPFESEDAEACAQFIRGYADRFPGMWTYTAR